MKFSVFVAGGTDRWDPRDDRPSAKCHAMMMIAMMMMGRIDGDVDEEDVGKDEDENDGGDEDNDDDDEGYGKQVQVMEGGRWKLEALHGLARITRLDYSFC